MNTSTQTNAATTSASEPLQVVDLDLQSRVFLQFGTVAPMAGEGLAVCLGIDAQTGAPMAVDKQTGLAVIAPDWDRLFAELPRICREGMPHAAH